MAELEFMLIFMQEISYSNLLEPSYSSSNSFLPLDNETGEAPNGPVSPRQIQVMSQPHAHDDSVGAGAWGVAVGTPYSPHMVDGWLVAGKHSRLISFRYGYIVSYFVIRSNAKGNFNAAL